MERKIKIQSKGQEADQKNTKRLVLRVCSAYKTVGVDAVSVLARVAPFELVALERKRIYERIRLERTAGRAPDVEEITALEKKKKTETIRQWKAQLERENAPGRITREAIAPTLGRLA